jgi:hypothetical protein
MEDYFDLDYEPPTKLDDTLGDFDSLLNHTLDDHDLLSLETNNKKRSRDDDDFFGDKKVKNDLDLDDELAQITIAHPISYTLKNTQEETEIEFQIFKKSFSITVKNRKGYESGGKGHLKFNSSKPDDDTLTELVQDVVGSGKSERVGDVVQIIVDELSKKK